MEKKNILLVDDETVILETLGNFLEQSGFAVMTSDNYSGALLIFRECRFDLVITDLRLNGATGLDLSLEIKKMEPNCGVFILTGLGTMTLAIEALRAGTDDFLVKPCDTDELLLRMAKFFEKQEAIRRLTLYEAYLPICSYCKRIHHVTTEEPELSQWLDVEEYLQQKGDVRLTHGCCPTCLKEQLAELAIVQKDQNHRDPQPVPKAQANMKWRK